MIKINTQSQNFTASEALQEFAEKRVGKLERFFADIIDAHVVLTLTNAEGKENKKSRVLLSVKGSDLVAEKSAESFEEAIVLCCEALEPQLEKLKNKK